MRFVGDEAIVLDRVRNQAHRLNPTVSIIWQHCDGKHSPAELLQILRQELRFPDADEQIVEMALTQLRDLELIDSVPEKVGTVQMSRRQMARTLAIGAALLPAILSITVPLPAQAASETGNSGGGRSNRDSDRDRNTGEWFRDRRNGDRDHDHRHDEKDHDTWFKR